MPKKRTAEGQIGGARRQSEAGTSIGEICHKIGGRKPRSQPSRDAALRGRGCNSLAVVPPDCDVDRQSLLCHD
jgi:hypothetical protein